MAAPSSSSAAASASAAAAAASSPGGGGRRPPPRHPGGGGGGEGSTGARRRGSGGSGGMLAAKAALLAALALQLSYQYRIFREAAAPPPLPLPQQRPSSPGGGAGAAPPRLAGRQRGQHDQQQQRLDELFRLRDERHQLRIDAAKGGRARGGAAGSGPAVASSGGGGGGAGGASAGGPAADAAPKVPRGADASAASGGGATAAAAAAAAAKAAAAPSASSAKDQREGGGQQDEIVDCPSYLRDSDPSSDPNAGLDRAKLRTRTRPVEPGFWISLHRREFDATRWGIMETGQYYERGLEAIWRRELAASPPRSVVLDVGANIGYFTLVSLATPGGHEVHSFEPNPANLLRLCESLQLNNWTSPLRGHFLHSSGVSDAVRSLPFAPQPGNPGMSRFFPDEAAARRENASYTLKKLVTLDSLAVERGWIPKQEEEEEEEEGGGSHSSGNGKATSRSTSRVHIAILKIDVEGQEHRVLAGARGLLRSGRVRNVFMEVSARSPSEVRDSRAGLRVLEEAGYALVGQGGWMGPIHDVPWPRDDGLADQLLKKAGSNVAKQLNVWFQPAAAANATTAAESAAPPPEPS